MFLTVILTEAVPPTLAVLSVISECNNGIRTDAVIESKETELSSGSTSMKPSPLETENSRV